MNKFDEFLKAYNDYPSQDNEGYIPDRGGFKCGFMAAWHLLEKENKELTNKLKLLSDSVSISALMLPSHQKSEIQYTLIDIVRINKIGK